MKLASKELSSDGEAETVPGIVTGAVVCGSSGNCISSGKSGAVGSDSETILTRFRREDTASFRSPEGASDFVLSEAKDVEDCWLAGGIGKAWALAMVDNSVSPSCKRCFLSVVDSLCKPPPPPPRPPELKDATGSLTGSGRGAEDMFPCFEGVQFLRTPRKKGWLAKILIVD